jgi:hypothetical protein
MDPQVNGYKNKKALQRVVQQHNSYLIEPIKTNHLSDTSFQPFKHPGAWRGSIPYEIYKPATPFLDNYEYDPDEDPFNYYVGQDELPKEFKDYFSKDRLVQIQERISKLLQGLHPEGKTIIVPIETIKHVLSRFFDNKRDNVWRMIDNSIETIVTQIRDEFEINESNSKLNNWIVKLDETDYGGGIESALRAHDVIKIREKVINRGFQYNY